MSEIVQFGFRELWVVSASDWSLPVFCDPYTCDTVNVTHWSVRPAEQLLAAPFTELSTRFAPRNLGSSTRHWVVTDEFLRRTATKASGCQPGDYLKWGSDVQGRESASMELVDERKEDKFLSFACERAGIDKPLGRFVWRAIKEAMVHWFKNVQKPVDMELFTIHPFPYRANWKEIMLSKHRDCPQIFNRKRSIWKNQLIRIGFIEDLGSTDLLAMNKNKSFHWGLEIQLHNWFIKELADGETTRLHTKGPTKYAKYYESSIRRRMEDILEVYADWLTQVELQVATVRESSVSGLPILVPETKRNKVLPSWHRASETTYQPDSGYPQLKKGQRKPRNVGPKIEEMLRLPHLLPGAGDLRGSEVGPHMDRPGNNGNGDGGVLLCDVVEVEAESSRLLAEGEGVKP